MGIFLNTRGQFISLVPNIVIWHAFSRVAVELIIFDFDVSSLYVSLSLVLFLISSLILFLEGCAVSFHSVELPACHSCIHSVSLISYYFFLERDAERWAFGTCRYRTFSSLGHLTVTHFYYLIKLLIGVFLLFIQVIVLVRHANGLALFY